MPRLVKKVNQRGGDLICPDDIVAESLLGRLKTALKEDTEIPVTDDDVKAAVDAVAGDESLQNRILAIPDRFFPADARYNPVRTASNLRISNLVKFLRGQPMDAAPVAASQGSTSSAGLAPGSAAGQVPASAAADGVGADAAMAAPLGQAEELEGGAQQGGKKRAKKTSKKSSKKTSKKSSMKGGKKASKKSSKKTSKKMSKKTSKKSSKKRGSKMTGGAKKKAGSKKASKKTSKKKASKRSSKK